MLKKNLAIFASYDSEQIVHEYVLTYLRELSKVADIIFVSDNSLSLTEQGKLTPYTLQCICYHHGMYDFGSYKLGYLYAYENHLFFKYDAYCRKICDYKKIISKICSNYDINQIENYNVKKYGFLCSKLYLWALKYQLIFDIKKVFFQKKVTKKGRLLIKILRIPVYSKSIINKQGEV